MIRPIIAYDFNFVDSEDLKHFELHILLTSDHIVVEIETDRFAIHSEFTGKRQESLLETSLPEVDRFGQSPHHAGRR
jgi:hypothetical protein